MPPVTDSAARAPAPTNDSDAEPDPHPPPDPTPVELEAEQHEGARHREEHGDDVAQRGQGQQRRGPGPVLAGLEPSRQHAQEQHGEGERDGERELAGQRGRDVAAVDGERPVEQVGGAAHGQQGGSRERQAAQAPEGPQRHGQADHAADHDELEGDPVGDQEADQGDGQPGQDHVELVGGEPVVPVRRPAGQPTMGEQVVAEERRAPHVATHVAARRGVVGQDVARAQLHEDEGHAGRHHQQRDPALDGHGEEPIDGPRHPPAGRGGVAVRRTRWRCRGVEGRLVVLVGTRAGPIVDQGLGHDLLMVASATLFMWSPRTIFAAGEARRSW